MVGVPHARTLAIAVLVGLLEDLGDLLLRQHGAKLLEHHAQLDHRDRARPVRIEKVECALQCRLRVEVFELAHHRARKLGKGDRARAVVVELSHQRGHLLLRALDLKQVAHAACEVVTAERRLALGITVEDLAQAEHLLLVPVATYVRSGSAQCPFSEHKGKCVRVRWVSEKAEVRPLTWQTC